MLQLLTTALLLNLVTTYHSLRRAVLEVAAALNDNDLAEARRLLSWHLVSRDTSRLTTEEVAGAAIESLAENVTDGLTTPLLAYAVGGLPMAWAYRNAWALGCARVQRVTHRQRGLGRRIGQSHERASTSDSKLDSACSVIAAPIPPRQARNQPNNKPGKNTASRCGSRSTTK